MNKLFYLIFSTFVLSNSTIDTIFIDNSISEIKWIGQKISGTHNGKVEIKNGYILKDKNLIIGGEIIMDMTSITVEDIESPKYNKLLTDHLKNEDFFNVEKFPISSLKILSSKDSFINDKLNSNVEILAQLTIKNITHEVLIYSFVDFDENISFGELIIDRTKWGIKYGSNSFFDNLGDRAIYNDFILHFKLVSK